MNLIKKLAGQTAIYGISSILGRILTYALVPLYTSVFAKAEYGVVVELYTWMAVLNVVVTFGMETTYFRFTTRTKEEKPYHFAITGVVLVSSIICGLIYLFAQDIAIWREIPDMGLIIQWLALILFFDAVAAIPFARLRIENRPKLFAAIKLGNIFLQVGLNTFFLILLPAIFKNESMTFLHPLVGWMKVPGWGVEYVVLSNLISSAFSLLCLTPYVLKARPMFDWEFFKPMLAYSWPILLTGLAGQLNERLGILIFEDRLPEGFYENMDTKGAIGVYGASEKLSIFMMLAIQAFRYAGEPFFFAQSEDKQAPVLFAKIMHYFVALCAIILVGVSLNAEWIGKMFLRGEGFREALYLVPILLTGRLFFGVYVNLSVWFKLTDRTFYGTVITCIGLLVTALVNYFFIPIIGYDAIAYGMVCCFFVMVVICYWTGQKHFAIPYDIKNLLIYIFSAIVLVIVGQYISLENIWIERFLKIGLAILYVLSIFFIERRKIANISA